MTGVVLFGQTVLYFPSHRDIFIGSELNDSSVHWKGHAELTACYWLSRFPIKRPREWQVYFY